MVAFTDDDTKAVTVEYLHNSTVEADYRLVEWHTGKVVWTARLGPSRVLVCPNSADVLVEPYSYREIPGSGGTRRPFTTPIIAHADGTTLTLPEVQPLSY